MNPWILPEGVTVAGNFYAVVTDFRDILDIFGVLQDEELPTLLRVAVALELFYEDYASIPARDTDAAAQAMMVFLNGGKPESPEDSPSPRRIDWEQDSLLIAADLNKVAGQEIRALEHLHWWTFLALFAAIGEGQLSTVVAIRDKLRQGKPLEGWERDYYREHRSAVDLKTKYTRSEEALLEELLGKR